MPVVVPFDNPADESRRTQNVALVRAAENAYQTWAAEFDGRLKPLLASGMDPTQAGQRVMAEMGEFTRELRASLADDLLGAEADSQ